MASIFRQVGLKIPLEQSLAIALAAVTESTGDSIVLDVISRISGLGKAFAVAMNKRHILRNILVMFLGKTHASI